MGPQSFCLNLWWAGKLKKKVKGRVPSVFLPLHPPRWRKRGEVCVLQREKVLQ